MSKSAIDYTASSFGRAEADRIGKTLNVLDAIPANVSTAQLMVSRRISPEYAMLKY